jgi:hypothetical protein
VKPDDAAKFPRYDMQCVDCHNRPTHTFQLPDRAVNRAIALGQIPVSLPFIKKRAVEVLKTEYATSEDAAKQIPEAIRSYYRQEQPAVYQSRTADVDRAANAILNIYNENVFPDLKVTWGTYPNNLGHTDFPGCFRCHDDGHKASDGKTITQDCGACHEMVATSEASPEVLRTLGLEEKLLKMQKK